MSQDVFKAPKAKRKSSSRSQQSGEPWSPTSTKRRRRTKEDFFTFCNIVLEYAQYESLKQEELREHNNTSPLDSTGSTAESFTSDTLSSNFSEPEHDDLHDSRDSLGTAGSMSPVSYESLESSQHRVRAGPRDGESGDDDSFELITCFCMKPFGGRPMIECSECLTWVHLSCAKIRKTNIPEEFICQICRESKFTTRKSTRIRSEKKLVSA